MFGGDFTMHVFVFSFQAFVCNSANQAHLNYIICCIFTITANGSAVICGHEYYVNTLMAINEMSLKN